MTDNKERLYRIVEGFCKTLSDEWGDLALKEALNRVINNAENIPITEKTQPIKIRPSGNYPTLLVYKKNLPEEKKRFLTIIARKYETKEFLPRLSDVRNFITMSGGNTTINIKDRNSGFKVLLDTVANFSNGQWDMFIQTAEHAGPTKLGPISDAISSVSKAPVRHDNDT